MKIYEEKYRKKKYFMLHNDKLIGTPTGARRESEKKERERGDESYLPQMFNANTFTQQSFFSSLYLFM